MEILAMSNIINVKTLSNGKTRVKLDDGRTVTANGFAESADEFIDLLKNASEAVKVGGKKFSGGAIASGKASGEMSGKILAATLSGNTDEADKLAEELLRARNGVTV